MGSICSSMSNTFSVGEAEVEQQVTSRRVSSQHRSRERTSQEATTTARSKSIRTTVSNKIDNKSEHFDDDSFSDEFVPVDEEHLYVDSYWWAQPKDVNEDELPWQKKQSDKQSAAAGASKSDGIDALISESKEQDPFENHPFFTMNIKRLTKPKSTKSASSSSKKEKKSVKEKEKVKSKAYDLAKFKLVYDDVSVPAIYPVLGDIHMIVDAKCHSIHEAFKSDPDDRDKKLIKVYSTLNVIDRAYIPAKYKELFGDELAPQIKGSVSGPFGHLILLLSDTIEQSEIQMIQTALDSKWSHRNEHLLRIICGRKNQEIEILKKTYKERTDKDLDSVMKKEAQKGAFRTYIKMCLKDDAMQEYDPDGKHTRENSKKVAKKFYDCGEKKYGTDTEEFLGILVRNPPPFLRLLDSAYEKKYKKSITKAIKNELTFASEVAVLYGVGMSLDPFGTIAKAMEKTFKGVGMDPIGFNSLIVRYHPYLREISEAYEEKVGETLIERIHYEAKGSHHDLLCKLVENAVNGFVDDEAAEEG